MCWAPRAEAISCKWPGSELFLATGRSEPYVLNKHVALGTSAAVDCSHPRPVISTMLPVAACCCLLACIVVVWWILQLLLACVDKGNEHLMSAEAKSLMQYSLFPKEAAGDFCGRGVFWAHSRMALGLESYFSGDDGVPFRSGRCAMCDRWLCGDSWGTDCQEAAPDGQGVQRCEGVPERA